MSVSLKQARSDLQYLKETYGDVCDYCGSFCQCDKLESILNGASSIKDVVISNIEYYFSNGVDIPYSDCGVASDVMPDSNDKRVQRIIERYSIKPLCSKQISQDKTITIRS